MYYSEEEIAKSGICPFRQVLQNPNGKKNYYIINEINSSERTKLFSAVEITAEQFTDKKKENENEEDILVKDMKITSANEPRSIKFIDKKFFNEQILERLNVRGEDIDKYYDDLHKSFEKYNKPEFKKVRPYVQELYDLIIDEKGIYFILEPIEYSLADYTQTIREPFKKMKYPIEIKFRHIIQSLLKSITKIHENGISLCSALNSHEIIIKEDSSERNRGKVTVKLPHPLVARVLTLIDLVPDEEEFISVLPPEVYKQIDNSYKNEKELKTLSTYYVNWDTNSYEHNQNFDKWSLGCLLYQLIFDEFPFKFRDLNEAITKIKKTLKYVMAPKKISEPCLKIVEACLRENPEARLQDVELNNIYEDIKNENSNKDVLEKVIKDRYESVKGKDSVIFTVGKEISQLDKLIEKDE